MNFKKKRSAWDLIRAAGVILLCICVPIWLLVYVLITGSRLACVVTLVYVWVVYFIARRFDHV